jgi:hypothetical protein
MFLRSIVIIDVSQSLFLHLQNILAAFWLSHIPILMVIKKPLRVLAIESKNSNNFGYNFGHY